MNALIPAAMARRLMGRMLARPWTDPASQLAAERLRIAQYARPFVRRRPGVLTTSVGRAVRSAQRRLSKTAHGRFAFIVLVALVRCPWLQLGVDSGKAQVAAGLQAFAAGRDPFAACPS